MDEGVPPGGEGFSGGLISAPGSIVASRSPSVLCLQPRPLSGGMENSSARLRKPEQRSQEIGAGALHRQLRAGVPGAGAADRQDGG